MSKLATTKILAESSRHLHILGTRGIPACHGGFETFAEKLALYLVSKGWTVSVYCQEQGRSSIEREIWQGVELVKIHVPFEGAKGSILFDWIAARTASSSDGVALTLGYNTALFSLFYRLRKFPHLINMDGLEWQRDKWSLPAKAWLYLNERFGCWFGDHLIADHPEIEKHLQSRAPAKKITMIPYGADVPDDFDDSIIEDLGLTRKDYALIVARPEPENSILGMVRAFSRKVRGVKLVVLGNYDDVKNNYQRNVLSAAGGEVVFAGAIYDKSRLAALRENAALYLHGHTVGGTNPALVEALASGLPVLAHDNRFNRWVAGSGAEYFSDEDSCAVRLDDLLANRVKLDSLSKLSKSRFNDSFQWSSVLDAYEELILRFVRP